jgi:hypothetical protein
MGLASGKRRERKGRKNPSSFCFRQQPSCAQYIQVRQVKEEEGKLKEELFITIL